MEMEDTNTRDSTADVSSPNYWDPVDEGYRRTVLKQAVAPVTVAIITLTCFLLFFSVRLIHLLCLHNACCPKRTAPRKPAVLKSILINIAIVSVSLLASVLAGAFLTATAPRVRTSLNGVLTTVIEQVELVQEEVHNITAAVKRATPLDNLDVDITPLTDANRTLSDAQASIGEVEINVRSITSKVELALTACGGVALAVVLLGGVVLIVRRSILLAPFLLLAACVTTGGWALSGVGRVTDSVFEDACNMMDRHISGQQNPWVLEQARCSELQQGIGTLNTAMSAANAAVADGNLQIDKVNTGIKDLSLSQPPLKQLCLPFAEEEDGTWVQNSESKKGCTPLTDAGVTQAYSERVCPHELPEDVAYEDNIVYRICYLTGKEIPLSVYTVALEAVRSFVELQASLPQLRALASCDFIDRAFRAIVEQRCGSVDFSVSRTFIASAVLAFSLSLSSLYFCICFQNIRKQRQADPEEVAIAAVTGEWKRSFGSCHSPRSSRSRLPPIFFRRPSYEYPRLVAYDMSNTVGQQPSSTATGILGTFLAPPASWSFCVTPPDALAQPGSQPASSSSMAGDAVAAQEEPRASLGPWPERKGDSNERAHALPIHPTPTLHHSASTVASASTGASSPLADAVRERGSDVDAMSASGGDSTPQLHEQMGFCSSVPLAGRESYELDLSEQLHMGVPSQAVKYPAGEDLQGTHSFARDLSEQLYMGVSHLPGMHSLTSDISMLSSIRTAQPVSMASFQPSSGSDVDPRPRRTLAPPSPLSPTPLEVPAEYGAPQPSDPEASQAEQRVEATHEG